MLLLLMGQHTRGTTARLLHRRLRGRTNPTGLLAGLLREAVSRPLRRGQDLPRVGLRTRTHSRRILTRRGADRPPRRIRRVPQRLRLLQRTTPRRLALGLRERQDLLGPLPQRHIRLRRERGHLLAEPRRLGRQLLRQNGQPGKALPGPVPLRRQSGHGAVHLLRPVTTSPYTDKTVRGHRSTTHP